MAYVKKTEGATSTKDAGIETTATKETTVKESNKELKNMQEQIDKLAAQNATLASQNEMLMKILEQMKNTPAAAPVVTLERKSVWDDSYTIVHLVDTIPGASTHIELSNITIDLTAFGEERKLTRMICEELAGKYRKWFEKGIIAFGADAEDIAANFGLKTVKDYSYFSRDFKDKLGILSCGELEELYNKVSKGHKDFIIQYFKRKIVEKDPAFKNIHKIEMLNRVSDGAMSGTLLDIQREKEQADKNNK